MARFEDVRESFWSDAPFGRQRRLTPAAVSEAEQVLGVTLPPALLDLLRLQNGGAVAAEWNAYPTAEPTSWAKDHVPFDGLAGIGRAGGIVSLLDTPYLVQEQGLPSPVVLLTGDGGYWIGLDYRVCGRQGEPPVTWFDTENGTDLVLAPDFRSFVEGLVPLTNFAGGELD